ncbi:MAG: Dabb family protein [Bryobacteraceae bacterium]
MNQFITRRIMFTAATAVVAAAGILTAANKFGAPKSIIHVVTILWKESSTAEQQQASLNGIKKMAAEIPGIKNVWINATKVQGRGAAGKDGKQGRAYQSAFVIEFKDRAAADAYGKHPAHAAWEKEYLAIREVSTSHQITN